MQDMIYLRDKDLSTILSKVADKDVYSIVTEDKYSLPFDFYLKLESNEVIRFIYTKSVRRLTIHRNGLYYFYVALESENSKYNLVRYPGSVYDFYSQTYEDMERLTKNDIDYARIFFILNYYFNEFRDVEIREIHDYIQVPNDNPRKIKTTRYVRKLCTIRYIGESKSKKKVTITAPCWTVVGHYRHLKNGNKIFINSYRKGKFRDNPSLLRGKDYTMSD